MSISGGAHRGIAAALHFSRMTSIGKLSKPLRSIHLQLTKSISLLY